MNVHVPPAKAQAEVARHSPAVVVAGRLRPRICCSCARDSARAYTCTPSSAEGPGAGSVGQWLLLAVYGYPAPMVFRSHEPPFVEQLNGPQTCCSFVIAPPAPAPPASV